MIYAPVLVPTLNRYEHLKRLIESLQKNKWAEFTELYIGVDFPPSEKYREGYEKICDYLAGEISGFKRINVYYHHDNLGTQDNIMFLINEISKSYDRYIFTEDDNEFSKNFLEYIDKGLEKFQSDERIIGICGHAFHVDWDLNEESLLKMGYAYDAWGIGRWIEKDTKMFSEVTLPYLKELLCHIGRAWHLYRVSPLLFYCCVETVVLQRGVMYDAHGAFQLIDMAVTIYMIDFGYYTINPVVSKVRNWGDDGSGIHGGSENTGRNQPLDSQDGFDFETSSIYDDALEIKRKMPNYLEITSGSKYKLRAWLIIHRLKFKALSLWLMYCVINKLKKK